MERTCTRLLVIGALTMFSASAFGQELDAQNFQPAVGPHSAWATEGARTVGDQTPTGGLLLNYASRPIVVVEETDDGEELISPVVDQQFATHLLFGLGIGPRLQLDLDLPLYLVNEGELPRPFNRADIGDFRLRGKLNAVGTDEEGFGFGVAADLTVPTGAQSRYVGAPGVTFSPRLIADYDFGEVLVAANAGVKFRETGDFGNNVELGNAAIFGIGAEYAVMRGLLLVTADVFGKTNLRDPFATEDTPVEALLGAKVVASHGITIAGAAGGGIVPGMGAPEFRMLVSLTWAPREVDFDEDGILDDEDECQLDPEDADGFEDEDGCPDPDNDGDGIRDDADECPDDAEDADGFEDEDGCPDLDNDGDGVPDTEDRCTDEAEDPDGFQDEDGCPDLDNDNDDIPDTEDACPDEPGLLEDRGCPPKETKAVREKDQIKILDKVYFETGEAVIKEESDNLLKQVALILRTNDDITRVEIGGHTDYRGNDQKNLELSQKRADAVRDWLIEYGIDADRLTAVGYGEEKPVAEGRSKEANAKNRRVEFKILGQGGDSNDESDAPEDEKQDPAGPAKTAEEPSDGASPYVRDKPGYEGQPTREIEAETPK